MREMISFEKPTRVICHFIQDEERAKLAGGRVIHFQVLIDCSDNLLSPSGEFIRFNHSTESELHGWMRVEDLVIDEILEEIGEAVGQWKSLSFNREAA